MKHTISTSFHSVTVASSELQKLKIPCSYRVHFGVDRVVKMSFSCEGAILRDIVLILDRAGFLD